METFDLCASPFCFLYILHTSIFPVSHSALLLITNDGGENVIPGKASVQALQAKRGLAGWKRGKLSRAEGATSAGCRQAHHLTTLQQLI